MGPILGAEFLVAVGDTSVPLRVLIGSLPTQVLSRRRVTRASGWG
jgi:hypothetical protein